MKRKPTQAELVKSLTDRELIINLYFTQGILLIAAFVAAIFLFDNLQTLLQLFQWEPGEILLYGGLTGAVVVSIDFALMHWLPDELYDDGGINKRIFSMLSVPHIFLVTIIIAVIEEILFRGVIQFQFGIVIASLIFALVHIRYLHKKFLMIVAVGLSFLLGLLFWYTGNLLVRILAHFIIDFILGLTIRLKVDESGNTEEKRE